MNSDRISFPLYRVETDNFDGQLRTRLSFEQAPQIRRRHDRSTGLVVADVMDGGLVGHITAPAGWSLGELPDGATVLCDDAGDGYSASDCYHAARSADRNESMGLGFSPAKAEEDQ